MHIHVVVDCNTITFTTATFTTSLKIFNSEGLYTTTADVKCFKNSQFWGGVSAFRRSETYLDIAHVLEILIFLFTVYLMKLPAAQTI
jgi:multisubunit Na+/H+ antiporter MnhF subunit